jgi:hypothetical protein
MFLTALPFAFSTQLYNTNHSALSESPSLSEPFCFRFALWMMEERNARPTAMESTASSGGSASRVLGEFISPCNADGLNKRGADLR